MRRWTLLAFVLTTTGGVASAREPETRVEKRTALAETERAAADIAQIASDLWNYSEISLQETRSAALLAQVLEKEGFRVERSVAGMPTAFVATFGEGKPIVGILAEFDALPGIGNAIVPKRQPREDHVSSGQGCGHNLFGAGSVGAALALKRTMQAHRLAGTLKVYGTPAEETLIGKTYMARDGLFDDLDAALEWHPDTKNAVGNTANQANNNFTVEFFGQPAHAAFDPWNGRSAVDAVELLAHGVNLMREHVKPSARMHYVIQSAGEAPNVVPAYARIWFYVRDVDRPSVEAHYAWMLRIAEGAALGTGTTHKVTLTTGVHEYLFNRPLQEAMQKNLELVGGPKFEEAELRFARDLQRELKLPEEGLETTVRKLAPDVEPVEGGSTDVAEVSYITPTAGLLVATAGKGLPWHSWATAASHGLPGASKAATTAAKVIALTAVDLLTQPRLLEQARAFHAKKTGGKAYSSPIPKGQKPPVPSS